MSYIVALYGSVARGDVDADSDLDVLLVGENTDDLKVLQRRTPAGASASGYTWNEIEAMRQYGSLFLHHLAADARVLAGDQSGRTRFLTALSSVPEYRRARSDVASFLQAVSDAEESVAARRTASTAKNVLPDPAGPVKRT